MNIVEIGALLLFLVGIYGLLVHRNIIKSIISINILDVSIILFFLGINYEKNMYPPIGNIENVADPVPQALMITAIVIGVAVTSVALTMFIALYHSYGTTNWEKAKKIRKEEK